MPLTASAQVIHRPARLSEDEIRDIAVEAYLYAYPVVLMEITRRTMTNVPGPTPDGKAPMNQFAHHATFPDASFTDVVRPNCDTLYSLLWYDVSREPLLIHVPDSAGRYYLLQMLDMWTDVFAAPGARTTGTGEQLLALVASGWLGELPRGAKLIRCPTAQGFLVGRTQTNGVADYTNVHKFQLAMRAVSLSGWGRAPARIRGAINNAWDMRTPPSTQVEKMSTEAFFSLFADVTRLNPPHAHDYPVLERMERIGIRPGRPFSAAVLPAQVLQALDDAAPAARQRIADATAHMGIAANGWHVSLTGVGNYGTDYLHRAAVASTGLGANVPEDAVYPSLFADHDGKPLQSDALYRLHFERYQLPPVRAFWSLTLYDERQAFAANSVNRYAIGDRDALVFNDDGSLDLCIQRESPGGELEKNWLPTPSAGAFSMNLRLYWPKAEVLDGGWVPPPLMRVH